MYLLTKESNNALKSSIVILFLLEVKGSAEDDPYCWTFEANTKLDIIHKKTTICTTKKKQLQGSEQMRITKYEITDLVLQLVL